jgi:hypothetical protein
METLFLQNYIPNWQRFCDSYKPKADFQEAFMERFSLIEDEEIRQNIGKKINVELGILLLHHEEIDESSFLGIINLFKESKSIDS